MQYSSESQNCSTKEFLLCDNREESAAQFEFRLHEKADVCDLGDADWVDQVILDQKSRICAI